MDKFKLKIRNKKNKNIKKQYNKREVGRKKKQNIALKMEKALKLSIFLPHFNRCILLYKTINQYKEYLKKINYELLICDDNSYPSEFRHIKQFKQSNIDVSFVSKRHCGCNMVAAYKVMYENANGNVFLLSNSEVVPIEYKRLIHNFCNINKNQYIVGSCYALTLESTIKFLMTPSELINRDFVLGLDGKWYQHSVYRDVCYNFFTMIRRSNYEKIGGLSDKYINSVGGEDVDFLRRIRSSGLSIIRDNKMLSVHLHHYSGIYHGMHK